MTTPTNTPAHFLSAEAQARCHMASEKMVAVKSEAGITKMEEYPILLVPVRQMPSGFSARMRLDVGWVGRVQVGWVAGRQNGRASSS